MPLNSPPRTKCVPRLLDQVHFLFNDIFLKNCSITLHGRVFVLYEHKKKINFYLEMDYHPLGRASITAGHAARKVNRLWRCAQ